MASTYGQWVINTYNYVYNYLKNNLSTNFDEYLKQKEAFKKFPALRLELLEDRVSVGSTEKNIHVLHMNVVVCDEAQNPVNGFEGITEKAGLVVDLLDNDRTLGGYVDDCRIVAVTHDFSFVTRHIVNISLELHALRKP